MTKGDMERCTEAHRGSVRGGNPQYSRAGAPAGHDAEVGVGSAKGEMERWAQRGFFLGGNPQCGRWTTGHWSEERVGLTKGEMERCTEAHSGFVLGGNPQCGRVTGTRRRPLDDGPLECGVMRELD